MIMYDAGSSSADSALQHHGGVNWVLASATFSFSGFFRYYLNYSTNTPEVAAEHDRSARRQA